jgi:two-component sensor histidine kinase
MTAGGRLTAAQDDHAWFADLSDAARAGEVGLWRWDVVNGQVQWMEYMEPLHRIPTGSFAGTYRAAIDLVHPEDRAEAEAHVESCLATGQRYFVQYRLARDDGGEPIWIEARGRVRRDGQGRAVAITGVCQDITARKHDAAELALRARQQEAVAQLGERALAGAALDEIFTEAVRLVAALAEADFTEILELTHGRDELTVRAEFGWDEPAAGQVVATSQPDTQVGAALRSGSPVVVTDCGEDPRFTQPERLVAHGVGSGAVVTIPGSEGTPFGAITVYCRRVRCISPTDLRFLQSVANVLSSAIRARHDQERRELLIGELRHRVGNLFSLVQALHRQTGQNAHDARDLEMKFGSRLASLASAHALILDGGWQKTSLRSLLEKALAPYIERVEFSGPDVRMPADSAFSFSMALHELATNANKYGALSGSKGRLLLTMDSVPDALGHKLVLVWKEEDGPPPPEAASEGFGSKLIHQVVERQLGGHVTRVVEPDGLRITMEFPVG